MGCIALGAFDGTARKVYDSLCAEDNSDWNLVKDYNFRAYERIPEFYRQQFRAIENKLIKTMLNLVEKKSSSSIVGATLNK